MKKCPLCKTSEGVRRYLYGMPSEEPDPAEYLIGGCLVSEDMPDYRCITCSTNFYRGSRNHHPFVSDGSEGEVSDGEEYFDEQD